MEQNTEKKVSESSSKNDLISSANNSKATKIESTESTLKKSTKSPVDSAPAVQRMQVTYAARMRVKIAQIEQSLAASRK